MLQNETLAHISNLFTDCKKWQPIVQVAAPQGVKRNRLIPAGGTSAQHRQREDAGAGARGDGPRLREPGDQVRGGRRAAAAQVAPRAQVLVRVRLLPRGDGLQEAHLRVHAGELGTHGEF